MQPEMIEQLKKLPNFRSENKRSLIFNCPNCGKEKKFSLEKSTGRGICYAGKCGIKTPPALSLSLLLGVSKEEANAKLNHVSYASEVPHLTLKFKDSIGSADELSNADFDEATVTAPVALKKFNLDHLCVRADESPEALEFLASRGVTDLQKIREFNLYHHPVMNGVIAPVHMGDNEPMTCDGFQCRLYKTNHIGLKVISAPGMLKARLLLNYRNAKSANNVTLCEGIIDCMKATQPGFVGVASFGKEVSTEQINLLKQLNAKNIYIALDRDAYDAIDRIAAALMGTKNVYRVLPPEHRVDIGDCTDEEVQEMYRNAVQLSGIKTARLELWVE